MFPIHAIRRVWISETRTIRCVCGICVFVKISFVRQRVCISNADVVKRLSDFVDTRWVCVRQTPPGFTRMMNPTPFGRREGDGRLRGRMHAHDKPTVKQPKTCKSMTFGLLWICAIARFLYEISRVISFLCGCYLQLTNSLWRHYICQMFDLYRILLVFVFFPCFLKQDSTGAQRNKITF